MLTRTLSTSMPSSSATIIAIAARLPPATSMVPIISATVPSSLTFSVEVVSLPMLNQNPVAMPRPWLGPSGTLSCGCSLAFSRVAI